MEVLLKDHDTHVSLSPCSNTVVQLLLLLFFIIISREEIQMFNNLSNSSSYQEEELGSKSSLFDTILWAPTKC